MIKSVKPQAADSPVTLIGNGGHALVLLDLLLQENAVVEGIITKHPTEAATTLLGVPCRWSEDAAEHIPPSLTLVHGVGNTARHGDSGLALREAIAERYRSAGFRFASVISAQALISPNASLGEAVQLLRGAIIQPLTHIGDHSIVNSGAIVEHGTTLGAFCHVAPGAVLCGDVTLGRKVHIGAGAVVRQGVRIGEGAVIGAGARVLADVTPGATIV